MQLPNPYFAAWIAGRTQMAKFLSSAQWHNRTTPWAVGHLSHSESVLMTERDYVLLAAEL